MRKPGILWGVLALVAAASSARALAASADHINVTTQGLDTIVTLSGDNSSAAAEIYTALDKAPGKLIQASVTYLNGAVYAASLTVSPTSSYGLLPDRCAPRGSCPDHSTRLVLGGDLAHELFEDLERAGDPETHGVDGASVRGTALSCSYFIVGGIRYSCSISLEAAH